MRDFWRWLVRLSAALGHVSWRAHRRRGAAGGLAARRVDARQV